MFHDKAQVQFLDESGDGQRELSRHRRPDKFLPCLDQQSVVELLGNVGQPKRGQAGGRRQRSTILT